MQPKLEKIPLTLSSSIAVKRETVPYLDYPWHYHPEYEIVYHEKSFGLRFIGNHIGNFSDGDLMFLGANLPHVWKNDKEFHQDRNDLFVDVYVIHFPENALTQGFFNLPEMAHIKKLFALGTQGLLIKGKDHLKIATLVKDVVNAEGIERLFLFLKTLDAMARTKDYELLSGPGYVNSMKTPGTERINTIMNFVTEHYAEEINIEEVARLANLSISSFCRYFKNRTHKTFSQFLNEIRILNACKDLINTDETITQICYGNGYNNISHFNRQFKIKTGLTAKEYKKKHAAT